jgi:GT2 family glycosyltransferase
MSNVKDKPLISVILASKGKKTDLLAKSIKSLNNQNFKQFETILVYTEYPSSITQLIEACNIKAIKETGKTLGSARNLGVRHAQADIVVFIDDDAMAFDDWLENIYRVFLDNPDTVCLGGPHFTPPSQSENNPMRFVEGEFAQALMTKHVQVGKSAVGKIAGCNVAYRKFVFEQVGFINEKLRSGEDWDFHMKLCEKGYVIRFDPAIKVWHHRQGLKHAFVNSSNLTGFFMSWRTLKFARYESFFASYYLSLFFFTFLCFILFFSGYLFIIIVLMVLLAHFSLAAFRSKTFDKHLVYYPLAVAFTLARVSGFYFGLFKLLKNKL